MIVEEREKASIIGVPTHHLPFLDSDFSSTVWLAIVGLRRGDLKWVFNYPGRVGKEEGREILMRQGVDGLPSHPNPTRPD